MLQPDFELLWGQNKEKSKSQRLLWNAKQECPGQKLKSFSREYYNMENKILGFQSEPVSTEQTNSCPNYSVRNPMQI